MNFYFSIVFISFTFLSWTKTLILAQEKIEINEETCGLSYSDRIVGGQNAAIGQYPWLARLGYNKSEGIVYECGGALISKFHILTASHCIKDSEPYMVVRIQLGEYDTESENDCVAEKCSDPPKYFAPEEIILPLEYNDPKMRHDIALIKLKDPVTYTNWIRPICLPIPADFTLGHLPGMNAEVAGWGFTGWQTEFQKTATTLQTLKIPIVNLSICDEQFKDLQLSVENQICAGGEEGKDSCAGDSGGPLQRAFSFRDKGPRYVAIGIVSLGVKQCGKFAAAALYTNVSWYMPWIMKNLNAVDLD